MRLKHLKLPSLLVLLLSLNLGSCASKAGAKKQAGPENSVIDKPKQNILFICVDDLRPMINSYGETKMITPNMDKLASQGLQFNNAYTNVAVCGASRASVMTGIRPSQTRFTDYTSKASVDAKSAVALNQIFKNNGYETISYGKIYHFVDDNKEYWTEIDNGHVQTDYQDPVSIARKNASETIEQGRYGPAFEYPDVDDYAYNDGKITKKAIEKLKDLKVENKPFFMAIGYVSPHLPFIQPKKYWDMYDHKAIKLADNPYYPENVPLIALQSQGFSGELRKKYLDIPKEGNLDDELSRNLIHGYYASITYMDALIGELVKNLDDLGLRENTTIVLWSDHGYFLGEHGMWTKHSTFREAVKIPLLISSPEYKKYGTTESMTELVDLYPTLCNIAQIKAPSYLQGESLIPVLENPSTIFKKEIYTRFKEGEAVIDKEYSYTEFYKENEYLGNMLYDNLKDPKQNKNISNDPSNAKLVAKYKEKLKIIRDKVNKQPF